MMGAAKALIKIKIQNLIFFGIFSESTLVGYLMS
jgi:hypothetical protein